MLVGSCLAFPGRGWINFIGNSQQYPALISGPPCALQYTGTTIRVNFIAVIVDGLFGF